MTGVTLVVDAADASGYAPLVVLDGAFATAMRRLTARGDAAAVPDRVLLELYAYEIVERLRELSARGGLDGVWRIPVWPERALAAAGVQAHAARELRAMWPGQLRVVRRAAERAEVERAMHDLFGVAVFDPEEYCATSLVDDVRDDVQRVAGVFLVRGECVLLEFRPESSVAYAGVLDTPGGKLEVGETAVAAIVRECTEELGITLHDACQIALVDESDPTSGRSFRHHVFVARSWHGEPRPREGQCTAWIPIRSLASDRRVNPWLRLLGDALVTPL